MATFAKKLEALRLRRGWSQRALARQLNDRGVKISQPAVAGWEKNATPRPEIAAHIAALFGVSLDLLTDDKRDFPMEALSSAFDAEVRSLVAESAGAGAGPIVSAKIPSILRRIDAIERELKAMRETLEDMLE